MKPYQRAINAQPPICGFLRAALLLLVCLTAPHSIGAVPIAEGVWWNELHVAVTPRMTTHHAAYAVDIMFTNRSKTDIARIHTAEPEIRTFPVSALNPTGNSVIWGKREVPLPPDSLFPNSKIIEILPGKQLNFCVLMKDALLPNFPTDSTISYSFSVSIMAGLSWKRQNGHVTEDLYESSAEYRKNPRIAVKWPPKFPFS